MTEGPYNSRRIKTSTRDNFCRAYPVSIQYKGEIYPQRRKTKREERQVIVPSVFACRGYGDGFYRGLIGTGGVHQGRRHGYTILLSLLAMRRLSDAVW